MTLKFDGWPRRNNRAPLLYYIKLFLCVTSNPSVNSNWSYSPETVNSELNQQFFLPCDLEIWWMTLKNNRACLLYHVKLCASFQSHQWIKIWVIVRKCSFQVKISDFLSRVTLKFDGGPCKTTGHLFYKTLNFVHHFEAMGEFKLELQSGNAQSGSKSVIFCPVWSEIWQMTLKNKKTLPLCCCKLSASFHHWTQTGVIVRKRPIWVKIDDFFVLCNLEIWEMTLENNRALLLCHFKLCASFCSLWWIQTRFTVRKSPIWVKMDNFLCCVTLKFDR